ncbi:MAG: hypothetical protein NC181_02070 [Clostridium sp.]|nr:hypothetical protein [Clostridium sp.]MCM1444093.1 hypothetical protein [Candidatus Amulumruptor caecigallinarius]
MDYTWLIILAIVGTYCGLSSKLDKIINKQFKENKNKFPSLQELVGKKINIETSDELVIAFGSATEGVLKCFNDTWIVIETTNKKNKKEQYYYRLNKIVSINIVDDKS